MNPDKFKVKIYYSLYSLNEKFRKRWMPNAMPVEQAIEKLKEFELGGGEVVFHWAFIEGENDDLKTIDDICQLINKHRVGNKVNIVRYNPFNNKSQESSEKVIEQNFEYIKNHLPREYTTKSKIVPRVGFDVKASCGMFVS